MGAQLGFAHKILIQKFEHGTLKVEGGPYLIIRIRMEAFLSCSILQIVDEIGEVHLALLQLQQRGKLDRYRSIFWREMHQLKGSSSQAVDKDRRNFCHCIEVIVINKDEVIRDLEVGNHAY